MTDSKKKRIENQTRNADIHWIGVKPVKHFISKNNILPPFRDEHQLRSVIFNCHTRIYEKSAHDPARAFDEMLKLLFLKLFDETENKGHYKFMILGSESASELASRIREFFKEAIKTQGYSELFRSRYNSIDQIGLELDDFTIYEVVQSLQEYGLLSTTKTIEGSDIKGRVYEQMVGRTFRGELGQFFTPRTIAKFMVELIDPGVEERVLDPACGTGGFLIMSINHVKKKVLGSQKFKNSENLKDFDQFLNHRVFGIDINDRVCRVAKINMLMHGARQENIMNADGLIIGNDAEEKVLKPNKIEYGSFQKILSNPPFAGTEKDPKVLKRFRLGLNKNGRPKSITKEVLFIEKIINLLDYGGKAGIVLPLGIFNNPSLKRVRDYIRTNAKISAVIGLPTYAFTHTGTSVKGALLFVEKQYRHEENYKIFMAVAQNIGYDSTGREIHSNDLDLLLDAYKKRDEKYLIPISELDDRIDAAYYSPRYKEIIEKVKRSKYPLKKMSNLFIFRKEHFSAKNDPEKIYRYIETNCVDLVKGRIDKLKKFIGRKAPSRAKLIARANDFLVPTARESFKGIAILPKDLDGIVVSNRFLVLHPIPSVNPIYLSLLFRNKEVMELIKREATGEIASSISRKSFDNIFVPVPPLTDQNRIARLVSQKAEDVKKLREHVKMLEEESKAIVEKEMFD